jgi:micrococcal nuclease
VLYGALPHRTDLPVAVAAAARTTALAAALAVLVACAAGVACVEGATAPSEAGLVLRVVDGDTLKVDLGGRVETVRLIGVDTPETVHPRKPVEYFGKEASAFTRRMADRRVVRLEADPQNRNRDKYHRLLRYVFLPDGKLLNAEIIAQGYGHAYTRFPFSRMEEFRALEREARETNRGLWAPRAGLDSSDDLAVAALATPPETSPADPNAIVYLTATGSKYHAKGCRYLNRSATAVALAKLPAKLEPCSVCNPPKMVPDPR